MVRFATISSIAAVFVVGFILYHPATNIDVSSNNISMASVEANNQEQNNIISKQAVAQVRKSISEGKEEEAVATIDQLEHEKIIPTLSNIPEKAMMSQTITSDGDATIIDNAYELHWLKICSLVKIGRTEEAKNALRSFVLLEGIYKEKADSLLMVLTTKTDTTGKRQ